MRLPQIGLVAVAAAITYRMLRPSLKSGSDPVEAARLQGTHNAFDSLARLDGFLQSQAPPDDARARILNAMSLFGEPIAHPAVRNGDLSYIRHGCAATKVSAAPLSNRGSCSVRIVTPPDLRSNEIGPTSFDQPVCATPTLCAHTLQYIYPMTTLRRFR